EVAAGQHEIDFKYSDALTTADNIMTFKLAVKTFAQKNGLHATFLPKPVQGINGSGMHTNMSLFSGEDNAFLDETDKLGLSKTAYSFMAGIMEHIKGMAAITNPLVNSYKRLVPGYEAPCYIAWSAKNRSPLIRVPTARGTGTRIELRNPDPTCNPYLTLAVCLAAGLDGIKKNMTPPPSVDMNIFSLTPQQRVERGIDRLPDSLHSAIEAMRADELVMTTLGKHITERYIDAKLKEWDEYRAQVTPWEIKKYFKVF
ncbi:MAG: glutamine synthetase, partial [Oscillospiraceae bacterium]